MRTRSGRVIYLKNGIIFIQVKVKTLRMSDGTREWRETRVVQMRERFKNNSQIIEKNMEKWKAFYVRGACKFGKWSRLCQKEKSHHHMQINGMIW